MQRFESKKDKWLVIILWVSTIAIVGSLGPVWFDSTRTEFVLYAVAMILAAVLVQWVLHGTYYVVDGDLLLVKSGPFKFQIKISEIAKVENSKSSLSSPALSMDRLKLFYGSPERQLLISPADKESFLRAIRK